MSRVNACVQFTVNRPHLINYTSTLFLTQDNNSVYIYGVNPKDGTLIDVRIAKRQNNVREVWFFLRLPGIEEAVVLPIHPATMVRGVNSDGFEGAGLKIEMAEPMKTWNINFEGNCR